MPEVSAVPTTASPCIPPSSPGGSKPYVAPGLAGKLSTLLDASARLGFAIVTHPLKTAAFVGAAAYENVKDAQAVAAHVFQDRDAADQADREAKQADRQTQREAQAIIETDPKLVHDFEELAK